MHLWLHCAFLASLRIMTQFGAGLLIQCGLNVLFPFIAKYRWGEVDQVMAMWLSLMSYSS